MKTLAKFLLTAVFTVPCFATSALAADWTLQPDKSKLSFSGSQTGKAFEGRFKTYNGRISFNPAHPEASHTKITIDMTSATTGDNQRDGALPGQDWFDIKDFSTAIFEITHLTAKGNNIYDAAGTLTIKGIRKAVTLPLTINISGADMHATGHLPLERSSFNVGVGPWSTGQWVALDVNVDIDVWAHQD